MDFQARCIQFLGETTGTSKVGNPWRKKEWVVETFGNYPKKVKVQCFGERSASMNMEPGRDYTISVDLESREFNGRWYTDVNVYRVDDYIQQNMGGDTYPNGGGSQTYNSKSPAQQYPNQGGHDFTGGQQFVSESSDEDLPF